MNTWMRNLLKQAWSKSKQAVEWNNFDGIKHAKKIGAKTEWQKLCGLGAILCITAPMMLSKSKQAVGWLKSSCKTLVA